ncbi:hypothetical protein [Paenibacillus amylolyticus]|uniref:hypothetical protein n=1 Tax=Paenibacillus amylolyticus TaxID=1451 RepID=UPI003390384B
MTYNGKTYKCLQAHTPLPGGAIQYTCIVVGSIVRTFRNNTNNIFMSYRKLCDKLFIFTKDNVIIFHIRKE